MLVVHTLLRPAAHYHDENDEHCLLLRAIGLAREPSASRSSKQLSALAERLVWRFTVAGPVANAPYLLPLCCSLEGNLLGVRLSSRAANPRGEMIEAGCLSLGTVPAGFREESLARRGYGEQHGQLAVVRPREYGSAGGRMTDRGASTTIEPRRVADGAAGVLDSLLRYRDYRLLWTSSLLTQIAQWMLQVASGWLMLELTDSALWVGLLGFAGGLPFLLVAAPAGTLAERLDRRLILLACQTGALAVSSILAFLVLTGRVTPLALLIATVVNGAVLAANNATRQAALPNYVPRASIPNAVALLSAGMNTTRIVGPSLAGPLVATLGVGGTLLVQAGCLVLALLNTARLPMTPPARPVSGSFLRTLVEGLSYVRRAPVVLALLLLASVPTLLVFPYLQLLPVFARDVFHLGPSGLGLLYTVGGAGALTGSLFVAGLQRARRRGFLMVAVIVIYGGVIATFTMTRWLPLVLACLFAGGFLGASYMALNNALLHLAIDDEVRGRVMGLYMITWGFMPLGALPMGALGDAIGVPAAVLAGAVASSLLALLVAWRVPALLRLP